MQTPISDAVVASSAMRDGVVGKANEVPDLLAVSQNALSLVVMAGESRDQSRADLQVGSRRLPCP